MKDAIIIGTGPAGLSAALNLKTYEKDFLWFGSEMLSDKVEKAEKIDNYPGFSNITGKELVEKFREHQKSAGIEITDKIVSTIYPMDGYYAVMAENDIFETKTVLLATGVLQNNQLTGEAEFLGRGVSYCATCDGALYKGKTIAVVCTSKRFEHEVKFLAELADKVILFPFYKDCEVDLPNVEKIMKAPIEVTGAIKVQSIKLKDETVLPVDGVFFLRNAIAMNTLLKGLETDSAHITVGRTMETNLAGVFAAGDCTGRPYQYTKAVGEGNVAAHSIIEYLAEK